MYNEAVHIETRLLAHVLDRFNEAVPMHPHLLGNVPEPLKTMEMCNEVMCINPEAFFLIPDRFKTQKMCIEGVLR